MHSTSDRGSGGWEPQSGSASGEIGPRRSSRGWILLTIVGLIIAYLLSFHLVVGPVLGTKVLVLPGEHVPDDAGYVLKDGQFLSYNREWLYASSTPSLNIIAYYVYYPVHKVLEATERAVFVKNIDNLLQETPEHRWPGRWRDVPKEPRPGGSGNSSRPPTGRGTGAKNGIVSPDNR